MSFHPSTLTLEALRAADPPSFIERAPDALTALYVARFEALTGRTLYPAQTEMFVIEMMAYAKSLMGEAIQTAFLQNRAVWATGGHLDEIGANVSTFRLEAQPARAMVRATLSAAASSTIIVPQGAELLAGDVAFRTGADIVIEPGATEGEAEAAATIAGVAGNGFAPGQLTGQTVAGGVAVELVNVTAAQAGTDREDQEAYRARVCDALERVSKAGPREGFRQMVKQVSPEIIDVDITRTQPGHIRVTALTATGAASDALDQAIADWLDPETRVPMGDYITVEKAVPVGFAVAVTVRVDNAQLAGLTEAIEAAVRAPFDAWSAQLGAQIAPERVRASIVGLAGVVDVDGDIGFAFTDLAANAFARLDSVVITLVEAPNV